MTRDQALDHVKKLITGDRNATHGQPMDQLAKAHQLKRVLNLRFNTHLTPIEIEAIESICVKLSRWTTGNRDQTTTEKWADHPLDIIGYAAIAVQAIYDTDQQPKPIPVEIVDPQAVTPPSPFAGVGQVARRFAPNPRKNETFVGSPPPEGTSAA